MTRKGDRMVNFGVEGVLLDKTIFEIRIESVSYVRSR